MRVSITDVARAAGVTPAVVSRVLNGDPTLHVRAQTRERVLAAVRELDYTPSHAARALRHSKSNALGLAVHDMSNPVYGEIIIGAQKATTDAGYVLLLADIDGLARGDETFRRAVQGGAIDGLLLQRAGTYSDRKIVEAATTRIPTVLINDRSSKLASVALDDVGGSRLATQHLIDLGHSRIGHLRIGGTNRSGARVRGWRQALTGAGLVPDERWEVHGGYSMSTGYQGMRTLLSLSELPTGVVAGNVLAGIGALTAVRDAGLSVPDDLSIVAFHDIPYTAHLVPPLTAVAMPLRELGAASVTLLIERLAGGAPRRVVVHDPRPELIVRGSTAPPSPRR